MTPVDAEHVKQAGDVVAVGAIAAAFFEVLPHLIAAFGGLLAIVWWAIRIYETKTVQRWLGKKEE